MEPVYPHLSRIARPEQLHGLSVKELQEVAREVRRAIVDHVSRTGGHFSSNLGTVELTVALYSAFRLPPDQVVWDTGHQAYPHKLLTGRLERFGTLRKHKGLSGFLRREESEFDAFGAGHAGTAISAALGLALARDLRGETHRVAAVTGDASIGSGMSWEALNHAGDSGTSLTVVLNDNRMSIAPNVGALTQYFARLRSRPLVQGLAQRAKGVAQRLPGPVTRVASGLRHSVTHYFAPEHTGTIFEELGFEYIGPIDGHDLPVLVEVFRNVAELKGPVFVHALTVKGKGFELAEEDSRKWHGVGPFDPESCEMKSSKGPRTFTQAFSDAMLDAAQDPAVVAITAAMPDGTGLTAFGARHPGRYHDVGIAEQHAVTLAAGMAAGGLKPFCAIYSTFLQRAFDQVLHDVCLQRLPVRFFLDRAGLVGDDGPTHHGAFDVSYLGPIPNLVLMAPRDPDELAEMVRLAVAYDEGPLAVRYPRGSADPSLPERRAPIAFGRAELLADGRDVALVAVGSMVGVAWRAAQRLREQGLEAAVLNARFLKPMDREAILRLARGTRGVVVLEENVGWGGFGERVREAIAEAGLSCPVRALSLPDAFVEHGPQDVLRAECGLSVEAAVEASLALIRPRAAVDASERSPSP
ncbi:MAG: 1-deoxy-D-xylulose-5-phosphate synthase [Fimbriimonadales bacterium]|nr:1-deoxy-D-xylulose-5-phosphate synthase [Fimbriimonadales bacterium]